MQRRQFLAASLAASAATLAREGVAQPAQGREYYQLRRYLLQSGPQVSLTEQYLSDGLIPALTKRGMGPVGAFRLDIGPETPVYYVLLPSTSVEALAGIDLELARDADFLRIAEPFWSAPANAPAFVRVDYSLLVAFTGWPHIVQTTPAGTKRIFQLRTYESPSYRDHVRKVEMFNAGEFAIFEKAGCRPVFFSETLVGQRMPSLTYMLRFDDLTQMDAGWDRFRNDPDWKKLSADPKYAFEPIVSNISNLFLSPLTCSQI